MEKLNAILALQDGTIVEGRGFGAESETSAEFVFNTSMSGYEEALTDSSYKGQVLMMTYPLIGNYGVREQVFESEKIQVEGFVVRERCEKFSHWQSKLTIDQFLKKYKIPGIEEVDTRALTIKLRDYGVMNAFLKVSKNKIDRDYALKKVEERGSISDYEFLSKVSVEEPKVYASRGKYKIAMIDTGVKLSIIRNLNSRGADVVLLPYNSSADQVMEHEPDGLFIPNGPGDPKKAKEPINLVKNVYEDLPIMGICFGNQIVSLALGGDTYKLKFGHRGSNQPVKDIKRNRTYITSQNHGFAVSEESLEGTGLKPMLININDRSIEGVIHKDLPIMTMQFHPEARAGPMDTVFFFDEMLDLLEEKK